MPQFRASLNDNSRGVIYNHKVFIIQATDVITNLQPQVTTKEKSDNIDFNSYDCKLQS